MKKIILNLLLLIAAITTMVGQKQRYLNQVFDSVNTIYSVYGQNATVITAAITGHATKVPLAVTIYTPKNDTVRKRPLVIYLHTGNFLPFPINQSTGGRTTIPATSPLAAAGATLAQIGMGYPVDSPLVEICTRLAKMGYVTAAIDYRCGWNPIASTQTERVNTLINAAYRGVQDLRNAIRYFKASVIAQGNPFGIDTSKIVAWGQGTGGYISMAAATMDSYLDIVQKSSNKFIGDNGLPYVIESVHGNIYGTSVGVVPAGAPSLAGDTLCYPNIPGISSDFQLCVNMGGALADTQWIDNTDLPMIGFQEPRDPFAPYKEGIVNVPQGSNAPLSVVKVQGTYLAIKKADSLGLQKKMRDLKLADVITQAANKKNDGIEGLYPVNGTNPFDSDPWNWWDTTIMSAIQKQFGYGNNTNGLATQPDMSAAKSRRYIDTIIAYYAPRAFAVLGLGTFVATPDLLQASQVGLRMSPNPMTSQTSFTTKIDNPIKGLVIYDVNGNVVRQINKINSSEYTLYRGDLSNGVYYVQFGFDNGVITKPLIVQ